MMEMQGGNPPLIVPALAAGEAVASHNPEAANEDRANEEQAVCEASQEEQAAV